MSKRIVATNGAPPARGCYSQGVVANGLLFCAGQLPLSPETGQIVEAGIEAQTSQVLRNLQAVVEAAGSTLDNVVKVTVFITDIAHWAAVNSVYSHFFPSASPARTVVAVDSLHYGALIEIDAIAVIGTEA